MLPFSYASEGPLIRQFLPVALGSVYFRSITTCEWYLFSLFRSFLAFWVTGEWDPEQAPNTYIYLNLNWEESSVAVHLSLPLL